MNGFLLRLNLIVALFAALPRGGDAAEPPGNRLARELAADSEHRAAAVEYRRLALEEPEPGRRAGYYWAAAYEYHRAGSGSLAAKMLDRAEDLSEDLAAQALFLRAEISLADGDPRSAEFYLASLTETKSDSPAYDAASRRLAGARLRTGDVDGAANALSAAGRSRELAAVRKYETTAGRSPALGGILGLIPGLGYAYSGEYANALRSLLLNGLFIYAMVDTANDEEWGAFAAVTFFELTWYTGSIYGGVDAAHRFNRNKLQGCIDEVEGRSGFELDLDRIPLVSLRYTF